MENGNEISAFKKTERLLYSIPKFENIIGQKKEMIAQLEEYGLPKKSKSIVKFVPHTGGQERQTDRELADAEIERLTLKVQELEYRLGIIYNAVETVKGDKYYDIIPLFYWERKSLEAIAEDIYMALGMENLGASTISRNKSRLVNEIKTQLFPVEELEELLK